MRSQSMNSYYIGCVTDTSVRLKFGQGQDKLSVWDSDSFLVFDVLWPVSVPEGLEARLDSEIYGLLGYKNIISAPQNPAMGIVNEAFRIEGRKRFISELECAIEVLRAKLERPHSKRRGKDIRSRIRKLQRRIELHQPGVEQVFLTEDEAREYQRKNNLPLNVIESTTIVPLLRFSDKYDAALDILKDAGVPNTELFRGLQQGTRVAFMKKFGRNFAPHASVYLAAYREDALEDVMRRLPIASRSGSYDTVANASLESLMADEHVKDKAVELGLPLDETMNFLKLVNRGFESARGKLLRAAKGFYLDQLAHEDFSLRWAAVRGLSKGADLPSLPGYLVTRRRKRAESRQQYREYLRFKKEEMPVIMDALNIAERFPGLANHPSLVAERLLREDIFTFEGDDPYGLAVLEEQVPIARRACRALRQYDIRISLKDFVGMDRMNRVTRGLEWIADNLGGGDYEGLEEHPYFSRALNQWQVLELLRKNPWKTEQYFSVTRDACLKLEELAERVNPEHVDRLYSCIFNYSWGGLDNEDKDHTMAFIELFADSDIEDEAELLSYMREMEHFSRRIRELPQERRQEAIRKYRIWKKLYNLLLCLIKSKREKNQHKEPALR
jgi:hypothetical protein